MDQEAREKRVRLPRAARHRPRSGLPLLAPRQLAAWSSRSFARSLAVTGHRPRGILTRSLRDAAHQGFELVRRHAGVHRGSYRSLKLARPIHLRRDLGANLELSTMRGVLRVGPSAFNAPASLLTRLSADDFQPWSCNLRECALRSSTDQSLSLTRSNCVGTMVRSRARFLASGKFGVPGSR